MTCRHFGTCGGCSLPGVPYAGQLEAKRARLQARFAGVAVPPLIPSPLEQGFRHKVAFVFASSSSGGGLVMGHYRAGSQRVVPIDECPVHSERGNAVAFALRDHLARGRVPAGILRHVLIRTTAAGRETAVMLVVRSNHKSLRAPVRAFLESAASPTGFFLNIHDRPGPYMVGRETIRLAGRSHVREDVLGARFLVSPTAFFQTNVGAAAELTRVVLGRIESARRVLDLYSGTGLFTVPLARRGASVVAIEDNQAAVRDAEQNVALNRVDPRAVRLIGGRVEEALGRLSRLSFDAAVLDPPRQGCTDAVIDTVFGSVRAPRVVYVSCNPERLAVERSRIEGHGYRLTSLQGLDMFPHTDHIEAVAVFEAAGPGTGAAPARPLRRPRIPSPRGRG